jgi:hypothetical protein
MTMMLTKADPAHKIAEDRRWVTYAQDRGGNTFLIINDLEYMLVYGDLATGP